MKLYGNQIVLNHVTVILDKDVHAADPTYINKVADTIGDNASLKEVTKLIKQLNDGCWSVSAN